MRKGKDKGCCKLNKVILSLASLIILIALALGVNAGIDCNLTTRTNYNVGTEFNASFNISSDSTTGNVTAFFECKSASTANSSYSFIGNVSNTSSLRYTNLTIGDLGVFILEDSNDYICRATCLMNASGTALASEYGATSSEVTGITFDRGNVPSTPTSNLPTGRQTSRTQTIQSVVNGVNTTSCRLTFVGSNPGSLTYTMTHTGNNCSQSFSNLASTTFRFTISASDGTNRSAETAESTFYVDIAGTSGAKKYIAATGGGALPSSTAQQRAFGQQAESALDRAIAKAPANAQQGLTNAKNAVTSQYKGKEAFKTWIGTTVGCVTGFFVVPVIGLIPGCITGHLVGAVI